MRVRLLGTGASEGWPNPWCTCASCRAAAAAGVVRGQTAALVDDVLLIEAGPESSRAATRQGATLAGVEVLLVTHAHPDHYDPALWGWRRRATAAGALTLLAPPAVMREGRPDRGVTPLPAVPGERHVLSGYEIRVLAAEHGGDELGPAVLYDVTGPDGARLLWASDTGPLPAATAAACEGRAYDALCLELTGVSHPGHLDTERWPAELAGLRRSGAVTASTQVCAVHLGHTNPPAAELERLLASWGARAPVDGEVLVLGATSAPPPPCSPGRVLVLGAASSGKSAYAESRLAAHPQVTYVATAPPRPGDSEWAGRVTRHRRRRPADWATVETGDVAGILRSHPGPLLVDDLGLWLTTVLDQVDGWDTGGEGAQPCCDDLVAAWRDFPGEAVLVAPEVGAGVVPGTPAGRLFRDELGRLTARVAAVSDEVVQVVAGLPRVLR